MFLAIGHELSDGTSLILLALVLDEGESLLDTTVLKVIMIERIDLISNLEHFVPVAIGYELNYRLNFVCAVWAETPRVQRLQVVVKLAVIAVP